MNTYYWQNLSDEERVSILNRPATNASQVTIETTRKIVERVRSNGDRAIRDYTREFDSAEIDQLQLSAEEIETARAAVNTTVRSAIGDAINRIQTFHEASKPQAIKIETAPGVVCERRPVPIQSVGLYVPSGRNPLPSTAVMLGVPSRIAGCPTRVLCVPPRVDGTVDPTVVFAATECGIDSIYRVGGAQAIAAMAYGTESIPTCDKLFGPGNPWVTAAKMLVSQDPIGAAIDMPAGPSEVMVIADENADADFIAADLLAQCEHGPDSQAILVTTSATVASNVKFAISAQLTDLPTSTIARAALESSAAIIVESIDAAVEVANRYAPEHLIIQTAFPRLVVDQITTSGSVFLGQWTPETIGDYCSGTNHVLPTYGFARAYSGLSVDSFVRYMTIQTATKDGLNKIGPTAVTLARAEGLEAHARAVLMRTATRPEYQKTGSIVGETSIDNDTP